MSTGTDLEKTRERVRVFDQCTASAAFLNTMLNAYRAGSADVEAIKRAKHALLFVITRRLDEFIEFQAEMKSQDSNLGTV